MGMASSDDEYAIMMDDAIQRKMDELAEIVSRRPAYGEDYRTELDYAYQRSSEIGKARELAALIQSHDEHYRR